MRDLEGIADLRSYAPPEASGGDGDRILPSAVELQRAGRLSEAKSFYRTVLSAAPSSDVAEYGLGLICFMEGQVGDAVDSFRRVLARRPDHVPAITNLATALMVGGRRAEAAAAYREAIALDPTSAVAHANLGTLLQDAGELAEAIDLYRRAIECDPDGALTYANLGAALLERGDFVGSVEASRHAADLRPDLAVAHANLSVGLFRLARPREACAAGQRALLLQPDDSALCATIGGVLLECGDFLEAALCCQRAIASDPANAMAHFNLAQAEKALNRYTDAALSCRNAIALVPDCPDYHFLLGHLLLVQGEFAGGWDAYEWRYRLPEFAWLRSLETELTQPLWSGEDPAGKTILVLTEQGIGDILLFVRYAELLLSRGARVILAASSATRRLLGSLGGVSVIGLADRPLPPFDSYVPLLSLPGKLLTSRSNMWAPVPYLHADPRQRAAWRGHLATARLRVGIVWAGNPATKHDAFRSPGMASMHALFGVSDTEFFVLQVGPGRDAIASHGLPDNVVDLGPRLDDLGTTAAVMSELDLVISSCTAPLHLAGALGEKTWAVLPYSPYFPWLLEGARTPWYPTMRLYRQDTPGDDWSAVIGRVRADLASLAMGGPRRRDLPPLDDEIRLAGKYPAVNLAPSDVVATGPDAPICAAA
jgi:tetratricopeptide (TPR) repeat protein